MRDTCAWVADIGFIAVCPDLFWRIEPGIDISDKTDAEWKQAFALFGKFDKAKGIEGLKAALAAARTLPNGNGKTGTMGYCLGGLLAFMMAGQSDADINISYYGVGPDGLLSDLDEVTKPLLVHIADQDEFSPPRAARKSQPPPAAMRTSPVTTTAPLTHSRASTASIWTDAPPPSPTDAAPRHWSKLSMECRP
jgi:carboxymethylenebutenolidase